MAQSILRLPATQSLTGLSRSTLYLRIAQKLWVKPVRLGARAIGFPASEVEALNAARIAGQSDDEIRKLVVRLEEARKSAASALQQH